MARIEIQEVSNKVFYIIFIFILLHCPLSGPDLIYISLLIIPCIIYYVTNKETLKLDVMSLSHVSASHFSFPSSLLAAL